MYLPTQVGSGTRTLKALVLGESPTCPYHFFQTSFLPLLDDHGSALRLLRQLSSVTYPLIGGYYLRVIELFSLPPLILHHYAKVRSARRATRRVLF